MDHELLAKELLRALRGKRTQTAFSRRLGYRSNASRSWEVGRAFPTASKFFWIAKRAGHAFESDLLRFLSRGAGESLDVSSAGIGPLLATLRGRQSIVDIAKATGHSRYAVSRWLSGHAEPRLPELLLLVDVLSLRLLDFVACFVDPAALASTREAWEKLSTSRRIAYEHPFSHAVLRAIELEKYQRLRRHKDGWIAGKLGISAEDERKYLELLAQSGQIELSRGRYRVAKVQTVDTRVNPEEARRLRAYWGEVAIQRLRAGAKRTFSYNLFSVSHADLERIRLLHREFFAEVQAIVAKSEPAEAVALAVMNLVELDEVVPVGPSAQPGARSGGTRP
jgi:transcriptional regulator with XRE-family HTH domain